MCISFKAKLINSPYISKIQKNKQLIPQKTSFVELGLNSDVDYEIVRNAGLNWKNGKTLATTILDNFSKQRSYSEKNFRITFQYFALLKDLKKEIDPENILGIASLYKKLDNTFHLLYLQVKPEETFSSKNRQYKHIGKVLIESMIKNLQIKKMKTYPINKEAEFFYKKMNFKEVPNSIYMQYED